MPDIESQANAAVATITGTNPPQPPKAKPKLQTAGGQTTGKQQTTGEMTLDSFMDEPVPASKRPKRPTQSFATTGEGETSIDAGDDDLEDKETQPDPEPWKKSKHKVKVDGEDSEVEYDELIRDYQLKKASDKRFQQAAEYIKKAEPYIKAVQAMSANPIGAALLRGEDPSTIMQETVFRQLQEEAEIEAMTPRERQLLQIARANEEKRLELEQQLAPLTKDRDARVQVEADARAGQEIETDLLACLQAQGIEQPPPWLVRTMATNMFAHLALTKDGERFIKPDAAKALKFALDMRTGAVTEFLASASPEELKKRLPKTSLDGLRKLITDEVISRTGNRNQQRTETADGQVVTRRKPRLTQDDFFAR